MHTAKEYSVSVTEEQGKDLHHNSQERPPFLLHRPVFFCPEFFFLLLFFVRPSTFSDPIRGGEDQRVGRIAYKLLIVKIS